MPLLLSQASSLNPGAELWVIADEKHSHWYAKLDWYLNFSLARLELKPERKISDFLSFIQTECQLEAAPIHHNEALLLSVSQWLPTRWVLILPYRGDSLQEWIDGIGKNLGSLKAKSLRIFLPKGISFNEAQPFFEAAGWPSEVTVVLD